jgi:hypothetical protein
MEDEDADQVGSSRQSQITLSGSDNYINWRRSLTRKLRRSDLWEVVNGDIDEETRRDWRRKDQCATRVIVASISAEISNQINPEECANAAELWEVLDFLFNEHVEDDYMWSYSDTDVSYDEDTDVEDTNQWANDEISQNQLETGEEDSAAKAAKFVHSVHGSEEAETSSGSHPDDEKQSTESDTTYSDEDPDTDDNVAESNKVNESATGVDDVNDVNKSTISATEIDRAMNGHAVIMGKAIHPKPDITKKKLRKEGVGNQLYRLITRRRGKIKSIPRKKTTIGRKLSSNFWAKNSTQILSGNSLSPNSRETRRKRRSRQRGGKGHKPRGSSF